MLVITRKTDESIIIEVPAGGIIAGEKIEITVLETSKDKVKLGVQAPREVKIMRNELLMAKDSNVEASKAVSRNVLDELMKFKK
jgi:carbon storage regulator